MIFWLGIIFYALLDTRVYCSSSYGTMKIPSRPVAVCAPGAFTILARIPGGVRRKKKNTGYGYIEKEKKKTANCLQ